MNSFVGSLLPPGERRFGKYELVVKLATGGMAEIFLASEMDGGERKLVVIKKVLPHLREEARFLAMFRDEARLASKLIHANICRVHDWGMVKDLYFMAMEYLHGVPLSRFLVRAARTGEPVPLPIVAGILSESAKGLAHAHELRDADGERLDVVHRDVSPPNVFVCIDGHIKLLDFGVAKARGFSNTTRTGTVKGKNAYMSPEQILGETVDHRSDVFSLGICLWESITSQRLFQRETDFKTFTAVTEHDAPDPRGLRAELPVGWSEVAAKALARDRDARFASAGAFHQAMQDAAGEQNVASPEVIGAYVREHFATELKDKERLIASIHGSVGKSEAEA